MSSLSNALRILSCFSEAAPSLGVTEIAARLEMPKSSVSRLLKEMGDNGLLEQDAARGAYRPGHFAFQLGNLYQRHLRVADLVTEALGVLVERTGLTGYAAVLQGADIVVLQTLQGHYPVRLVWEKGRRMPAYRTAVGTALLARLDDADIRRRYAEASDGQPDKAAVDDVIARAKRVRKAGVAHVRDTSVPGFSAIAAAVDSAAENQMLGFALSFPTAALSEADIDAAVREMQLQARRIGEKTQDRYWTAFQSSAEVD